LKTRSRFKIKNKYNWLPLSFLWRFSSFVYSIIFDHSTRPPHVKIKSFVHSCLVWSIAGRRYIPNRTNSSVKEIKSFRTIPWIAPLFWFLVASSPLPIAWSISSPEFLSTSLDWSFRLLCWFWIDPADRRWKSQESHQFGEAIANSEKRKQSE
jgi:hypothetical protein